MKSKICLVCSDSPGLVNDAKILSEVLANSNDFLVETLVVPTAVIRRYIKIVCFLVRSLFDIDSRRIGIFIEDIRPFWLRFFSRKILVPNPEWMRPGTVQYLPFVDAVWCKTSHALSVFRGRAPHASLMGFSSRDCFIPEIKKDFRAFLHLQGRSMHKGTSELLMVWSKHPEWPVLTVVSRDKNLSKFATQNIKFIFDFISDDTLFILMNAAGVHICASTVEGFGHSINEAMSCASVVLTTDAAPMNELVSKEAGILVESLDDYELGFSVVQKINMMDLENKIQKVIDLPVGVCEKLGAAARASFSKRDRLFRECAFNLINDLK